VRTTLTPRGSFVFPKTIHVQRSFFCLSLWGTEGKLPWADLLFAFVRAPLFALPSLFSHNFQFLPSWRGLRVSSEKLSFPSFLFFCRVPFPPPPLPTCPLTAFFLDICAVRPCLLSSLGPAFCRVLFLFCFFLGRESGNLFFSNAYSLWLLFTPFFFPQDRPFFFLSFFFLSPRPTRTSPSPGRDGLNVATPSSTFFAG